MTTRKKLAPPHFVIPPFLVDTEKKHYTAGIARQAVQEEAAIFLLCNRLQQWSRDRQHAIKLCNLCTLADWLYTHEALSTKHKCICMQIQWVCLQWPTKIHLVYVRGLNIRDKYVWETGMKGHHDTVICINFIRKFRNFCATIFSFISNVHHIAIHRS